MKASAALDGPDAGQREDSEARAVASVPAVPVAIPIAIIIAFLLLVVRPRRPPGMGCRGAGELDDSVHRLDQRGRRIP